VSTGEYVRRSEATVNGGDELLCEKARSNGTSFEIIPPDDQSLREGDEHFTHNVVFPAEPDV